MAEDSVACCKVGRVVEEYDIGGIDAELVDRWLAGSSVRALTESFNTAVIDRALDESRTGQPRWSRRPIYDLFTTKDPNESNEIEMRRTLERDGIDVERLESSMVSHQTLYRHFTACLGRSKQTERSRADRRRSARETIFSLQERLRQVTETTINGLNHESEEWDALVDLRILCDACGSSMDVETALSDGCDCPGEPGPSRS
jgi:hypothetical protein